MGRRIAGVVVGYVVMFVAVFASFSLAYLTMGADRAFQPGSYDVTPLWIAVSIVLGTVAAIVGGLVAVRIARHGGAARTLAIVVVVLGVIFAIPTLNAPESTEPRTADVSNSEAMMKAHQPPAVAFITPVIGAIGVMIGGRLRRPDGTA